jgi:hypothetical protein
VSLHESIIYVKFHSRFNVLNQRNRDIAAVEDLTDQVILRLQNYFQYGFDYSEMQYDINVNLTVSAWSRANIRSASLTTKSY